MSKKNKSTVNTLAKDPEEFLKILNPTQNHWYDPVHDSNCWIYRGHSDEKDELIPSLYRHKKYLDYFAQLPKKLLSQYPHFNDQVISNLVGNPQDYTGVESEEKYKTRMKDILKSVIVEIFLVEEFLALANKVGLPVPTLKLFRQQVKEFSATDYFYRNLQRYINNFYFSDKNQYSLYEHYFNPKRISTSLRYTIKQFIECDFPEVIALARHHGIDSRYLDWTSDPYVAAFFAANCNASSKSKGNIAVYCLNTKYINSRPGSGLIRYHKKLPYAGLEYLHKQNGLFTDMLGVDGFYFKHGYWPSIEQYLLETNLSNDDTPIPVSSYLKIVKVSKEGCKDILSRLDTLSINKSFLMPTYDNAAMQVKQAILK